MSLIPLEQVMSMPMIVGAHTSDEVQMALDWASSAVESYCEREFKQVLGDTVQVDPYYSHVKAMPAIAPMAAYGSYPGYGVSFSAYGSPYIGTALLDNPPVTAVTEVYAYMPMSSVDGDTGWQPLVNFQWAPDGLIWDTSGMPGVQQSDGGPLPSWPQMPRSLKVVYDHGFVLPGSAGTGPALPQGVIDAVIEGCATYLANPANVAAQVVGDVSTTFRQVAGQASGPAKQLNEVLLGKYRLVHL